MKDTDLFDAIAHIDEDLIDRCLAEDDANRGIGQELSSEPAVTVTEIKPSSTRKRIITAIASIAAALVLTFGLVSILHIGGKKPDPIGNEGKQTAVPTEADPTPELTPEPTGHTDYEILRAFFEQKDDDGVKNGEKLFPNYDPGDPISWYDDYLYGKKTLYFNEGKLTSIDIICAEDEPVRLVGSLDLNRFEALEVCRLYNVIIDGVRADDMKTASVMMAQDLRFPFVTGEAVFKGAYVDRIWMRSNERTSVELTGESEKATWLLPAFKVEVNVEGAGYAGVTCYDDENYYEVFLDAEPMAGRSFLGWFDENGELVSEELKYELYGEVTGKSCSGAHDEHKFTARFDADFTLSVPEGYDAHDYAALAEFFASPIDGVAGLTIGETCYYDPYAAEKYDIADPSTWHKNNFGVVWDETGHVTEISFFPGCSRLHAELELTGFEKLQKISISSVILDKITIMDCPMLTDGCMVNAAIAEGEAYVEAGFVDKLNVQSRTRAYCSLLNDKGAPFTMDLTSEGNGNVVIVASPAEDDEYCVGAVAIPDDYVDFLGWYDEEDRLVSNETEFWLAGDDSGIPISGDHKYTARFSLPPAPTPLPEGDFFCEVKPGVPSYIDLDGDGEEDTILISTSSDMYESKLTLSVTLAADPENTFLLEECESYDVCAAVIDFDPEDNLRELLVTFDACDADPITYIYRWNEELKGFDCIGDEISVQLGDGGMIGWYYNGVPEDFVFDAEKGLKCSKRTEILGTQFVYNRFTLTKNGIQYLNEEFTYRPFELTLEKELKVTLENGQTKTLRAGSKITAYSTDLKTFVKVKLEDGRIGRVEVTFGDPETCWPIMLNGAEQDKYARIVYED